MTNSCVEDEMPSYECVVKQKEVEAKFFALA